MKTSFFKIDELSLGTKGLVFVGEKIIIYRRDDKTNLFPLHLDVPGGGKDSDETPYQTFKREVFEEFGLKLKIKDIVYYRRYPSVIEKGKFGWYAVAKLDESQSKKIVFGDEGTDFMLMTVEEFLDKKDAWPVQQERARDYILNN